MTNTPNFGLRFCRVMTWLGSFLLAGTGLHAEKLVTVRSIADPAYAQKRAAENPARIETYVFAKGQYSAGIRGDNSLDKLNFMAMAKTLALDLKKQRYEPAKSVTTADLLIVVHWGVTLPSDRGGDFLAPDPSAMQSAFEAIAEARQAELSDASFVTSSLGAADAARANFRSEMSTVASMLGSRNNRAAESNADLLGFRTVLEKEADAFIPSVEADAVRSMVDEERYFIILMAYDCPALREGKKRRVWTTRMSIRAAGVNFPIAIDRMSSVAANFHGQRQEGLSLQHSRERRGEVLVGDPMVVNETPPK